MGKTGELSRRGVSVARAMLLISAVALLAFLMGYIWLVIGYEDAPPPQGLFQSVAVIYSGAMLALSVWLLTLAGDTTVTKRGFELQTHGVRSSADPIVQLNEALRIVALNPAAERRFGHSSAAASGMPFTFLLPEPPAATAKRVEQAPITPPAHINRPPEAKPVRMEEPQTSARRLATRVGTRLSHLVQPLLGFTEIALESLEADHPVRTDLQEIGRASSRVVLLAQALEMYGGASRSHAEPLELNGFLERLEPDLRFVLQPSTRLQLEKSIHPVTVNADPGLTRTAALLLACNAEEAMPPGSIITLTVGADGLRIADSGAGLPSEVRIAPFKPLTSTKDAERGVGLGLHAARAAMRLQHADLQLQHSGEQGSVLALVFPRLEGGATTNVPGEHHEAGMPAASGVGR